MSEKLTVQCPYCYFMKIQLSECKDLVINCPSCGAAFKITATDEEAIIRIKKKSRNKTRNVSTGTAGE